MTPTDTPAALDWSAVEENMDLLAGIEKAVRLLVRTLPPQIRDALGWVAPTATPTQIARDAIASYREYLERYGYSPDAAEAAAVAEVTAAYAVDLEAIRAEMAGTVQVDALESEGWPF